MSKADLLIESSFKLENGPVGEKMIEMMDVNGKSLLTKTFRGDQLKLVLAAPAGLYMFRIWNNRSILGSGRLIKS